MRMSRLVLCVLLGVGPSALAGPRIVQFSVDLQKDAKPISRFIYGVNHKLEGDWANLPFTRYGGNRLTAYNWTKHASNAGSDWQFENDSILPSSNKPGAAVADPIENAKANQAGIV